MTYQTASFIEIKMDAEISSYQQEDFDPLRDGPAFVARADVEDLEEA
jgi:hypothetical protein